MDRRISHILNLFTQSIDRRWTIAEMAAEVELSVPRFHQTFKQCVGVSPLVYLRECRLERAAQLLADSLNFKSVKEIAYSVGISDDSHFTRDFKKKFGISPTLYRRRI